ncbi:MAG: hypothetical protein D6761_10635 [Candidatus Dadabacteria bacterium]|nr:MAG: hypothetical protein D6761_10635 [Candidatus Dadabacteria bacterium]
MRQRTPHFLGHLLSTTLLIAAMAAPAFAIGVIGEVTVRVDGYRGWHQTMDRDLEIHFNGVAGNTGRAGTFLIRDLGIFGREFQHGARFRLDDPDQNYLRFLLGRYRVSLPVEWEGRVDDDVIITWPMRCEILANGTGGCLAEPPLDPDTYANKLRRRTGLPEKPLPAGATSGAPVAPRTPEPVVEQTPELAPTAPAPVEPVAPVQPVAPKPAPSTEDPIEIIEPMD